MIVFILYCNEFLLINFDWGVLLGENNFYIKIILYYIFLCLYYIVIV